MSKAPRAKTTVKAAQPAAPRPRPPALPPARRQSDTVLASCSDTGIRKRAVIGPIIIRVDTAQPAKAKRLGFGGRLSIAACVTQLIIHEAPAWAVSMVVHMVTLVTLAMVAVPDTASYKAPHLIVTPPEQEKIEPVRDLSYTQPTTLDENVVAESVAFDSQVERDVADVQPTDDLSKAPSAEELSDFGLDRVPKSDLLTLVGSYSGADISGRKQVSRAQLLMQEGGNESSEKAVAMALKWLASHQLPDGGWSFNHTACPTCHGQCRNGGKLAEARNAATALALLPFLGTGQTHKDGKYRLTIRNGLSYLIRQMRMSPQGGALNEPGGNLYAHGIASIALCEAYAMTHDKHLLKPAQAALNFIAYAQDPVGGGWRYVPHESGDTSMVGWQLMALKSGHMAGLRVPPLTVHHASLFLDSVQRDDGAAYRYTNSGDVTNATTSIGLLCRMYLGWKKDNPALQRGVAQLSRRGPSGSDMYYNYYATQVMRHWEGDEWQNWNRQMRDQLVHAQSQQGHEHGSWFTLANDVGAAAGGRLYCTAMATMILEVYYRHLPIYRSQSVDQDFPE